jgi:hypothetical protein
MAVGIVVEILTGIIGGEWLGQGGTSTQDVPPVPLKPNPPDERTPTKPVAKPKPNKPSGREGVKVDVNPPVGTNIPRFPKPPEIKPSRKSEPEIITASLPPRWKWGPFWAIPEFIEQIRDWLFDDLRTLPGVGESPSAQFQFGKLLTGNMTLDVITRTEWTYIVTTADQKAHHQESYEGYQAWLANQVAGIPYPADYRGNFYDQCAILWPFDPRDFSAGLTLLFGARFLGDLFANMWTRSLNYDAATLRGVVYYDVDIVQMPAPWERVYLEGNPEEADNNLSIEGLMTEIAEAIAAYRASQNPQGATPPSPPRLKMEAATFSGGLAKVLAVNDFPFKVPVSLLLEKEDIEGLDDPEKAYEKIESIPQLILWLTKALDELIGKFPIKMEIAESDLVNLKEEFEAWEGGNREPDPSLPFYLQNDKLISYRKQGGKIVKSIKIPNLAEAVAEMLGADLISQQNQTLGLELATRSLLETGSSKHLGVQVHALAEAIADYLGFESRDKEIDVEYTYNPALPKDKAEGSYKRLLKPSTVQTTIMEFVGKNGLEKTVATIQETHGIVKAALTEGIGSSDAQLKRRLLAYAAELGIKPKGQPRPPGEEPPKDDFDNLLERIEWGFIDQPGMDQNLKPYGRDYSKRPRIKRLTKENEGQQ